MKPKAILALILTALVAYNEGKKFRRISYRRRKAIRENRKRLFLERQAVTHD